jgi:excisionase family DNA binding protein
MFTRFCDACNQETMLFSIEEAAQALRICRRTVYHWIDGGRLHLMEDAGGHTLICKRSLIGSYSKASASKN